MKKIGFCINSLGMGGAEVLLVDIINLLFETKKYKIYLITKNESNSFLYNQIKDKIEYSFLISKAKEKKYNKISILGKLFTSYEKRKNIKKFCKNLDVVIDFLDGDFCKYLKNIKNIEKIIWLHLDYDNLVKNKKLDKKLGHYNKTIVITQMMYNKLSTLNFKEKLYFLYNLIDYSKIDSFLSENIEDKLLNKDYFLTVCRLDESQKDVTSLLKAFANYQGKELLYIIGEGNSRKNLEILTKKLKIENRVRFLGIQKNPFVYMKNSKALILSTKSEGFGLVIAEALYCGTKVIASNCEYGPSEILLNGEIGELFEVGNIKELTDKLNIISTKNYSQEKINYSLKRFDKKEFFENLEKILLD